MSRRKTLLGVVGISLGGIGVVVCVVAVILLWIVSIRVGGAIASLFDRVDQSLVVVQQWGVEVNDRLTAAAITTDDLEKALEKLQDRSLKEAGQRLAIRLDAAQKAERLASGLQQVDHWLEVTQSSMGLLQEICSIAQSTGASTDTTPFDELREQIESTRAQLAEAMEFVGKIQDRITDASDAGSPEARIDQAIHIAKRVIATLHSLGSPSGKFATRVLAAQDRSRELNARTQRWQAVLYSRNHPAHPVDGGGSTCIVLARASRNEGHHRIAFPPSSVTSVTLW